MSQGENGTKKLERMQKALLAEQEKFSLFLSLNTNCFFEYDEISGMVAFAKNDTFVKLSGLVIELSEDSFLKEGGIYQEDYQEFYKLLRGFKDAEKELRFWGEDGRCIWGLVKTAITKNADGTRILIGCINDNSTDHRKMEEEKREKQCDSLTGVYNNIYIKKVIHEYLTGQGKELKHALLLMDIDDLKSINDRYGRLFGDTVLTNMVEGLRHILPENTIIGRVGGDEFILFIHNLEDMEYIKGIGETILNETRQVYAGGSGEEYLTCSIGAVRYPMDGDTFDKLFQKADIRLFQAKSMGKGFLELSGGDEVPSFLRESEEYYDQYRLRFNQENKDNQYRSGQEITDYAHDLMATTKDSGSGIKILLEKIGKEYNASSVIVLEKIKGRKSLCETYRWDEKSKKEKIKLNFEMLLKEKNLYNRDGLCVINDIEEFHKNDEIGKIFKCFHAKAMIQCAFYEEGQFKGMICINDNENKREWSDYEIETFLSFSRVMSFYLFRMRVSEKIRERLEHMKNFDTLTGLPTLHKFKKDAKKRVESQQRDYAVIYCDIGNFKFINDVYGYDFGDRILHDFALNFVKFLPENSLVGRISADNFVALVPFVNESSLEEKIIYFSEKFHDSQKEKHIGTNLVVVTGICVLPMGGSDINTVIDNANVARKSIKGASAGTCRFYDKKMGAELKREQQITNDMEDALKNSEFVVYLQPKVSLEKELLVGAEALVRWKRKDGTVISPDEFIPVFERNGFIIKLDFYVYDETCKIIRWWMNRGTEVVPISVNVSRIHLLEEGFAQKMKNLVDSYFIPPKYIELELTESVFISDTEAAIDVMKELRGYGFKVSIDDFGAGYSSLTLLKDMATDVIKLDKEFFANDVLQEEERIIVSSIIGMAKKLDMKVISEGIETKTQNDFLKDIKCDMVQGYYYAKPMPVAEFEKLMEKTKKNLAKEK